jgi:hypothetical protein
MRATKLGMLGLTALGMIACGDLDARGGTLGALRSDARDVAAEDAEPQDDDAAAQPVQADVEIIDERTDRPTPELACPRSESTGPIGVAFGCDEVTVRTCKDLSNVVIELEDGSRYRVEGLSGHTSTFVAPDAQAILRVWVKAGSNASGEGPGYGERFEAPEGSCAPDGSVGPSDEDEEETEPEAPEHEVVV